MAYVSNWSHEGQLVMPCPAYRFLGEYFHKALANVSFSYISICTNCKSRFRYDRPAFGLHVLLNESHFIVIHQGVKRSAFLIVI